MNVHLIFYELTFFTICCSLILCSYANVECALPCVGAPYFMLIFFYTLLCSTMVGHLLIGPMNEVGSRVKLQPISTHGLNPG